MNRVFMRDYYRNTYQHPSDAAIENSREYEQKKIVRCRIEDELTELMGGTRTELYKKFDDYISALADENYVIQEEMYLLGAKDREKMLQ